MDVTRLEIAENQEASIHDYTRRLFDSMGDKRHSILASSCSTSLLTPWKILLHFHDAAREYGRV